MTGVLIVGGSVAGVRTAQRLRAGGYAGSITIVDRERHLPYDRPPLSKDVLLADEPVFPSLLTAEEAENLRLELALGVAATSLDVTEREVGLSDGRSLGYQEALVVATGARARTSPWPGVLDVRCWEDAVNLRTALRRARSVLVIGAGFIGAEVASAARGLGLEVHLIDIAEVPMARHFGAEIGALFADLHRRHGVNTHFGATLDEIAERGGRFRARLGDGTEIAADVAVAGLGTELNTEWLTGSGLAVDSGVVCDAGGRAQNATDVYAVGDTARWWHPARKLLLRSEHWTSAVEQAGVVAHNILNQESPREHLSLDYVWSNQHDWKIQIAGTPGTGAHHLVQDGDRFAVLWARDDDELGGVLTVNWPQVAVQGRRSLAAGQPMSRLAEHLAGRLTPSVPGPIAYGA
ncbi:ferredoxin reductase [Acrocarpospora pleiomorpha]|uniref:Ferredoxin reductase n=1 Tax=Acrocarpospora pleiomorpha TaxID=90975 RepID=A0A5M3Y195_9ACTN|nr:FAD-dependent oxidoreductase [Acrocarpospora pleiomorpha]GES25561.1 ferredoxin reductase [Acrocarpospora pleiomorpha]